MPDTVKISCQSHRFVKFLNDGFIVDGSRKFSQFRNFVVPFFQLKIEPRNFRRMLFFGCLDLIVFFAQFPLEFSDLIILRRIGQSGDALR